MTAPPEHLALAAEFPAATREQWRALVSGVLTKAGGPADVDPEDALTGTTYDGIAIRPLYTAADAPYPLAAIAGPGQDPFVRGRSAEGESAVGWDVRQRHGGSDAQAVNRAVLTDLENGVTSIWLAVGAGSFPVADLATALDGVYLDLAPIALDAGEDTAAAAAAFLALVEARGIAPADVGGSLGGDPIGHAARTGGSAEVASVVGLVRRIADYPRLRAVTVDGTVYHDAGGSDADELAAVTSAGVAYLRALTDGGIGIDAALDRMEFRLAVTDNQFASIAKLRAARRVWARVAALSGASEAHRGQRQHAVTSAAMMTQRDPWVNMLRTTIACFAAAAGAADAITVAPFDAALAPSDDFSRRIARNTQSVLHDESSLARVADPAGGSWYVESLTDQLAHAAWERFRKLEAEGGAADRAAVEAMLAPARERRAADIAHRRFAITGVSEFALLDERTPARRGTLPTPTGRPAIRYAEAFEGLRDRADAAAVAGSRPTVFLAALGPVAAHSGRLGFAANLFQAGGLEPVVYDGDLDGLPTAFEDSDARVACLCSADPYYAAAAGPFAQALKHAGAKTVWLAGQPGDRAASDAAAGIDDYVFVGCDAVATLTRALEDSVASS